MGLGYQLKERFLCAVREKRVASAYLLEGVEGVGKLDHARYFASALCCLNPNEDAAPCGVCLACRRIAVGEFIDVSELRPESPDKQITVDSVRSVISDVALLPSEADWRIFIVERSENMNAAAQNALLKSMEEPPAGVVFFLLTSDRKALLPTVLSRAVILQVEPPPVEELLPRLQRDYPRLSESRLLSALQLSGGAEGRARELLEGGELFSLCNKAVEYLEAVSNSSGLSALTALFPPAKQSRQSLSAFLSVLKLALRDVLLYQSVKEEVVPRVFDQRDRLCRVAMGIPPRKAALLFDRVEELLERVRTNVNSFAAVSSVNLLACSKG